MTSYDRSQISFAQAEGQRDCPNGVEDGLNGATSATLGRYLQQRRAGPKELPNLARLPRERRARLYRTHAVTQRAQFADSVDATKRELVANWRPILEKLDYVRALGLVEWLARNSSEEWLSRGFARAMEEEHCAYRLIENNRSDCLGGGRPSDIFRIGSNQSSGTEWRTSPSIESGFVSYGRPVC